VWHHGPAEPFAHTHDIPRVYDYLDEMADAVDIAVVSGADWSTHITRAAPFIARGRAVFVDKPFASTAKDLATLVDWADGGARLSGGSSLRWAVEPDPAAQFALAGCIGHEFDYGVHAYSLLHGLFGPGMRRARWLGGKTQVRVEIEWADGRTAMTSVGGNTHGSPYYATVLSAQSVRHVEIDPSTLYRTMLDAVMPYLAGNAPNPMPMSSLVEPERAALAALRSHHNGGHWVDLDDLDDPAVTYDGPAFAAAYRAQRR